jgi:integrase
VQGYSLLWRDFKGFAASLGRAVMPASSDTVMDFLTWLDLSGRGGRASAAVSAIAREHVLEGARSPSADPRVRLLADGVERAWARTGKRDFKRDPFPVAALHAHVRRGHAAGELWLRDALLVALGLRTMRRAAELAALRIEDVTWLADRELLRVYVRSSKVDQAGRGFEIFVEPSSAPWCPVRLHRRFMLQRGSAPGLLFRSAGGRPLTSSTITSICKRMVRDAGGDAIVSSHSLRIGGATAAMMGGLRREQIMAIGGWHSGAVDRYLRAVEVTKVGASTLILGTGL